MHLEERDIPAYLADAETVATNWLLGSAIGNVKLQVRQSQAEQAAAILSAASLHAAAESSEQQDDGQTWLCLGCRARVPDDQSSCPSCGWTFGDKDDT